MEGRAVDEAVEVDVIGGDEAQQVCDSPSCARENSRQSRVNSDTAG